MSNPPKRTTAPWRIGVLFSRTGFMSVIEETQFQGTLLAIEEINAAGGVCGRELVPVSYDPGSDFAAYGHFAKRLMQPSRLHPDHIAHTAHREPLRRHPGSPFAKPKG